MSIISKLTRQLGKPTGWYGRLTLWRMNRSHSRLTDWGLGHVSVGKRDTILDVGCGGGRTVRKLADMATEGKVYGIDHSEASVVFARKTNPEAVAAGRVDIRQGSVSQLPFADDTFDLVTAVETHYFWPDLPADLREVRRVLKPGGTFVLIAEAYKGGKYDRRIQLLAQHTTMTILSADELRDLLSKAGYGEVQIREEYDKGWICGIGRKPASSP